MHPRVAELQRWIHWEKEGKGKVEWDWGQDKYIYTPFHQEKQMRSIMMRVWWWFCCLCAFILLGLALQGCAAENSTRSVDRAHQICIDYGQGQAVGFTVEHWLYPYGSARPTHAYGIRTVKCATGLSYKWSEYHGKFVLDVMSRGTL